SELLAVRPAVREPEASAAFEVVIGELEAASREIADLVAGTPPADLGDGRLRQALDALVAASPVPVVVAVADDAAGDQGMETARFYACCEALANAVKHANATRVAITVERLDGGIVAAVSDDGCGGGGPSGLGLPGGRGPAGGGAAGRRRGVGACGGSRPGGGPAPAGSGWTARREPARR